MTTKSALFNQVQQHGNDDSKKSKITVVGIGQVGMASAYSIMLDNVCNELVLMDIVEDKLKGEMLDLQHCQQFSNRCKINAGSDYAISANSDIVIITAGARQREGESRLNLVQRNVDIFKSLIAKIVQHSPHCILVVVSNPVDILAYVAWKLSGFPRERVIGTGTMLDSARFRHILGDKLNVSSTSVHGYILGEHGDSSVPVWSSVNVGGTSLQSLNPQIGTEHDPDEFAKVHEEVVRSAYEIIRLKGYTSWAIGASVAHLVRQIMRDAHTVISLSVLVNGVLGIQSDLFLSVPVVTCRSGIKSIVTPSLSDTEKQRFQASCSELANTIQSIQW